MIKDRSQRRDRRDETREPGPGLDGTRDFKYLPAQVKYVLQYVL